MAMDAIISNKGVKQTTCPINWTTIMISNTDPNKASSNYIVKERHMTPPAMYESKVA